MNRLSLYILATVDDPAQVSKWKSLAPGDSIRFRVTLAGSTQSHAGDC